MSINEMLEKAEREVKSLGYIQEALKVSVKNERNFLKKFNEKYGHFAHFSVPSRKILKGEKVEVKLPLYCPAG